MAIDNLIEKSVLLSFRSLIYLDRTMPSECYKWFSERTKMIVLIPVTEEYFSQNIRGKGLILQLYGLINYSIFIKYLVIIYLCIYLFVYLSNMGNHTNAQMCSVISFLCVLFYRFVVSVWEERRQNKSRT